jgi:AraC family transcriptional regulator
VKPGTRDFYEQIVRTAAARIVGGLDQALALSGLAREACLSPLHFHRIFRGMLGETPLELHRRLRLERAALQLATEQDAVTRVALQAGYETHESFTRAFRDAYSISPSEFRERARALTTGCAPHVPYEIAAQCGLHYQAQLGFAFSLRFLREEGSMKVEIEHKLAQRVAALTHVGPYNMIGQAFGRLGAIVGPAGLMADAGVQMVAIYHDDPEATPASELRSEAGITVPEDLTLPPALHEVRLPAGRYARMTHVGPYDRLGDAWAQLMGSWLPASGERVGNGTCYEAYRTMDHARPADLETDLYVLLA